MLRSIAQQSRFLTCVLTVAQNVKLCTKQKTVIFQLVYSTMR